MAIHRFTLFIVPKEEDIEPLLAEYRTLRETAVRVCTSSSYLFQLLNPVSLSEIVRLDFLSDDVSYKDGQPYILEVVAGRTIPDPRSLGYNLAVKMTFKDRVDMDYYDTQCEAHKHIKSVAGPILASRPLSVFFEDEVSARA
jgi:hypothetical protein